MFDLEKEISQITSIGHVLSDKTRVKILIYLLNKKASVSDLTENIQIDQPRISTHITLLHELEIVSVERIGRQRFYYITNKNWVEQLLTTSLNKNKLDIKYDLPKRSKEAEKLVQKNSPIRQARTCYDHLAGVSGVRLLELMLNLEYIEVIPTDKRPNYNLTNKGKIRLSNLGVKIEDTTNKNRKYAYGCPDWTERKNHLGGYLGSQILRLLEEKKFFKRDKKSRTLFMNKPVESIFK